MPKLFRLTKNGKLNEGIFRGETINTPSMLCVEDYRDTLAWVRSVGGLEGTIARSKANAKVIHDWIADTPWIANLAQDSKTASNTSICLTIRDDGLSALPPPQQAEVAKKMAKHLEDENVAFDIGSYRDAPAGLRIWTGATVDTADLEALTPWLTWAFHTALADVAP